GTVRCLRARCRLDVESLEERTVPSFVDGGELPTTWAPHAVRTGHFTPNDTLDVVTVNQFANQVSVLLGNGDDTFQGAQFFDAGPGVYSLSVGDLRGSGVDDIVVANYYDDSVNVLLNNGDGTFDEPVRYSTGAHGHPIDVALVDLTGDGTLSIVVANNN